MIKTFENFINERIDFLETAKALVKHYGLKSDVVFVNMTNKGEYDWENDIIRLNTSHKSKREFIITVLHEIYHAKDAKKMGVKKYKKEYQLAGDLAVGSGNDFHKDNKYEIKAEDWAQKEVKTWIN